MLHQPSGDTSFPPWHVHVGQQEERQAACVTEPCTPVGERKPVERMPEQRRQKAVLGSDRAVDLRWPVEAPPACADLAFAIAYRVAGIMW